MTIRHLVISLICLFFLSSSYAAAEQFKIMVKSKTPQGVTITKNRVIAKKGYTIEKVSKHKAIARMSGGRGGLTGEFDCTCNGSEGGCSVVTTPNSVTCAATTCRNCMMIVTIPSPGSPAVLHR